MSRNIILDIKETHKISNRTEKLFKYTKYSYVEYYNQYGWIKSKILSTYREKGRNKYYIELSKSRLNNDIFNCCDINSSSKTCYCALSPELRSITNLLPFEEKGFELQ